MEEEGKKWYQRDWDGWLFVFCMQLFLTVFAIVVSFFNEIEVVQGTLIGLFVLSVVTLKFYIQASNTLMALLERLHAMLATATAPRPTSKPPTRSGRDLN